MRDWYEAFPNVTFGFTSKSLQNVEPFEALRRLSIEKLIETDAHYFKKGIKSPWQIHEIVHGVSEIKNIPTCMSVIRAVNHTNIRKMYGIVYFLRTCTMKSNW